VQQHYNHRERNARSGSLHQMGRAASIAEKDGTAQSKMQASLYIYFLFSRTQVKK